MQVAIQTVEQLRLTLDSRRRTVSALEGMLQSLLRSSLWQQGSTISHASYHIQLPECNALARAPWHADAMHHACIAATALYTCHLSLVES